MLPSLPSLSSASRTAPLPASFRPPSLISSAPFTPTAFCAWTAPSPVSSAHSFPPFSPRSALVTPRAAPRFPRRPFFSLIFRVQIRRGRLLRPRRQEQLIQVQFVLRRHAYTSIV